MLGINRKQEPLIKRTGLDGKRSFRRTLPLPEPSAPPVIPKWNEPALRYEFVHLRLDRHSLCGPEVIINYQPARIGQQIAVAIKVPAHVIVRIKDKQAYVADT